MRPRREVRSVLDASVLLAYLQREPGHERVRNALTQGAAISAVNLAEVYAKVVEHGLPLEDIAQRLHALGLGVATFGEEDARRSARFHPEARKLGLSLGDRACLALGARLGLPVLTADRAWTRLAGVNVELVR